MENFTIAITTFAKRYDYIVNLIPQIRNYTDNKIILIINGEKDGEFDETYRKNVLELCAKYNNVYPTMFVETRGLCKMWNTGLILSDKDDILILNDDIEILSTRNDSIKQYVDSGMELLANLDILFLEGDYEDKRILAYLQEN